MSSEIIAICMNCKREITGNDGTIHIPNSEVSKVEAAQQAWDAKVKAKQENATNALAAQATDMEDLFSLPEPAHWLVHCDECNPHHEADGSMCNNCYWFDVERCATWPQLVEWTCHLHEKVWFEHTDWMKLIRGIHKVNRVGLVAAERGDA